MKKRIQNVQEAVLLGVQGIVQKAICQKLIFILLAFSFALSISAQSIQEPVELVVLDEAMDKKDEIMAALNEKVKVMILKQSNNQLEDLTDSLKQFSNLKALHLLVCGKDGYIMLNGSPINNENIGNHSEVLSQWKASFQENADLLIYTCNLANSESGKLVIRRLSAYTGLDVAASVNDTGNIGNESDWELEFMRGSVETGSCFNFQKISKFPGKFQRAVEL